VLLTDLERTHKLYWLVLPTNVRYSPKSGRAMSALCQKQTRAPQQPRTQGALTQSLSILGVAMARGDHVATDRMFEPPVAISRANVPSVIAISAKLQTNSVISPSRMTKKSKTAP